MKNGLILFFFLCIGTSCSFIQKTEDVQNWSDTLSVSSLFSDHAVLQRNATIPVWGWGSAGKNVRIYLAGDVKEVRIDEKGKWIAYFKTPEAGIKDSLVVLARDTLIIRDIIYGDVWLCAGQSNMEMPLASWGRVNNYQEEIQSADYPLIRLFQSDNSKIQYTYTPLENVRSREGWQICSPDAVETFSAVAYFFGRDIFQEMNVPVGLIQATSGGTPIEAWMPREMCLEEEELLPLMSELNSGNRERDMKREAENKRNLEAWYSGSKEFDEGLLDSIPWYDPAYNDTCWTRIGDVPPGYWDNNGFEDNKGVFWYRKRVEIPAPSAGREAFIRLGQIYERNELYINGEFLGEFTSNARPVEYKIPKGILKKGENVIVLRISANRINGGIRGLPDDLWLATAVDTFPLTGEWMINKGFDYSNYPQAPTKLSLKRRPSIIYNALIHPLIPISLKGIIWYQGESNMNNPEAYKKRFPALIEEYRNRWDINFPFYFVQIANYMKKSSGDKLAWLREAQTAALVLDNVYMIPAIDLGDCYDIHPKKKQEVGYRLAQSALKYTYGKSRIVSGPIFKSAESQGNILLLSFHNTGLLRTSDGDSLRGFKIGNEMGEWQDATAVLNGDKVVISGIKNAMYIRYAWENNPDGNLTDDSGLPAVPFRTDHLQRNASHE